LPNRRPALGQLEPYYLAGALLATLSLAGLIQMIFAQYAWALGEIHPFTVMRASRTPPPC